MNPFATAPQKGLILCALFSLSMPCLAESLPAPNNLAASSGNFDSCNSLLNLGLYNVTQSSSATDAQSMAKSTFCSYDYSRSDISSSQAAQIEASYSLFSGGASGSASQSQIIETQRQVCTSGFNSSSYSNTASSYAKTVYTNLNKDSVFHTPIISKLLVRIDRRLL